VTLFDPDSPAPGGAGGESVGPGLAQRPDSTTSRDPARDAAAARAVTPATAPTEGILRLRLVVAYDGTGFRGFAAQPRQRTVGGELARVLEAVIGQPVELTCAGRTDAGVHAVGQVVHFDVDPAQARDAFFDADQPGHPDLVALKRSCNRMLGPEVVVRQAERAGPYFDARRSAVWRRYRYQVLNREEPDPFVARTVWHVDDPLDIRSMQLSCDAIHGEHDFASFCRRPQNAGGSTTRRVIRAGWNWRGPDLACFDILASAFCHQMVRSLVGTMVDIGRGRRVAGDMAWILRSGDRSLAGPVAPPHGLCLEEVGYPEAADRLEGAARVGEGEGEGAVNECC
jgi:tRNA pseudouridine38-40 synthase